MTSWGRKAPSRSADRPSSKEHPNLRALVEGHTDSIGSDAYNQRLSERRANAVGDYMIARGIEAQRITTKGWGESKPIASNKTKEGRAQNRRVEITVEQRSEEPGRARRRISSSRSPVSR